MLVWIILNTNIHNLFSNLLFLFIFASMKKATSSRTRMQLKKIEKPFIPALRLMSEHIHNTSSEEEIIKNFGFCGYKMKAGTIPDSSGRQWEIQLHAVMKKDNMIKKNEIIPILSSRKKAFIVWLRTLVSSIIKWHNSL